jgi:predicted nucleic acid-binding protein
VEAVATAALVGFNAVVLGELLSGFRSGGREVRNRQELREFLASPRVQVLPMGLETGERFAAIHQLLRQTGKPLPPNDMWIAASAMEHGLRVLTADTHFRAIPTLLAEYLAVE